MTRHECPECDCTWTDEEDNRVHEVCEKRFSKGRWMCDVLSEMRSILDSRKAYDRSLVGDETLCVLIEEAQSMANRMEAGLRYKKDINEWENDAREIAKKVDTMQQEAYEMGLEIDANKHNALKLED